MMDNKKKFGQFFTPKSLADKMVETVIKRLEAKNSMYKVCPRDLMQLTVLDPAVGSGEMLTSWCVAVADRVYDAERSWRDKIIGATIVDIHGQFGVVVQCIDGMFWVDERGRELYQPMLVDYGSGEDGWISSSEVRKIVSRKCDDDKCFNPEYQKILSEVAMNCYGYDIDPLCAELTKQSISDLTGVPAASFDEIIQCADYLLLEESYVFIDVVIMNPPYLGGSKISTVLGDDYRKQLKKRMATYHGRADLCSYFIQLAHDHVSDYGGFISIVATNTISQGKTRLCGLKTLVDRGCKIYNAETDVPWPGDAKVTVSIVHLEFE
jgi:hypothetical protein